jgi:hypothetical protein
MPPLKGGSVKKFGVTVALLEPLDARFLSPQNFFLGFPESPSGGLSTLPGF